MSHTNFPLQFSDARYTRNDPLVAGSLALLPTGAAESPNDDSQFRIGFPIHLTFPADTSLSITRNNARRGRDGSALKPHILVIIAVEQFALVVGPGKSGSNLPDQSQYPLTCWNSGWMAMIAVMAVALRSSTTNRALDVPRTRVLGKIQGTIGQTRAGGFGLAETPGFPSSRIYYPALQSLPRPRHVSKGSPRRESLEKFTSPIDIVASFVGIFSRVGKYTSMKFRVGGGRGRWMFIDSLSFF